MKVLVVRPYSFSTPHLETELEIIKSHLESGDDVSFLSCSSEMLACDGNPDHDLAACMLCVSRKRVGLSLLPQGLKSLSFFTLFQRHFAELSALKAEFATLEELRRYKIENFDIGYAVLSSVISLLRDPSPNLMINAGLFRRLIVSALSVYRSVQTLLEESPVDRVYVFNGRFAPMRAVWRACQSKGVDCFLHERGHDIHHFELFRNALPHDIDYIERAIRQRWELGATDPDQKALAEQFFFDRMKGVRQSWFSFIEGQQSGLLPANWSRARKNIAVFDTSEDECAAIDDNWRWTMYSSQYQGLQKILESLGSCHHNIHLYLRVHPHLRGVTNSQTEQISRLNSPYLTVIPPDAPISTYALLQHADTVLTFGSTVGIEAVFWGKPSILAGPTYYQNLGGTYNPRTHDELIDLLRADLIPKEKQAALMYGYYMNTFGIRFKYFKATDLSKGEFAGQTIRCSTLLERCVDAFWTPRLWRARDVVNRMFLALTYRRITGRFNCSPMFFFIHFWLGSAYLRLGDRERAEVAWTRAMKGARTSVRPLVGLAQLKLASGDFDSAIMYSQHALKLDPSSESLRTILANAHLKRTDQAGAGKSNAA